MVQTFLFLLFLLTYFTGALAQFTLTQPPSLSASLGETVTINCKRTGGSISDGYVSWYQQKPGSSPLTVIYLDSERPSGIPERFSGSVDSSSNSATLSISNVQGEDEAVYYCLSYEGSGQSTADPHPAKWCGLRFFTEQGIREEGLQSINLTLMITVLDVWGNMQVHYGLQHILVQETWKLSNTNWIGIVHTAGGFSHQFWSLRGERRGQPRGSVGSRRSVVARFSAMAQMFLFLLFLLTYFTGALAQSTLTQPPSLSASLGETARITCTKTGGSISSYYVSWYQQKPGSSPLTVIYKHSERPSGIPERFSGSVDSSSNSATLSISNVQGEDEADYYCFTGASSGQSTVIPP
ncbi:uncharacterized protein LOC103060682, partial [Python bivittatus]|uniref:Uncharacterized protein LOC103060682 n=1 Tax=Python bivittatus TaxID=176946 RepID=A0A9F5N0J8_PYTBI